VLGLSKGGYYYKPKPESAESLAIMRAIDLENTEHPTKGVLGMVDHLSLLGFAVGPKRVRRLMRKMCITAIYPRRSLSKGGAAKFRMPYLLWTLCANSGTASDSTSNTTTIGGHIRASDISYRSSDIDSQLEQNHEFALQNGI